MVDFLVGLSVVATFWAALMSVLAVVVLAGWWAFRDRRARAGSVSAVPADDPDMLMYCYGCGHTHRRGGMEWNDELQFRCVDCCSEDAMDRASLAIGRDYIDYLLNPAVKAENEARLHREAAEFHAVYWAERVREYQQQYPSIADRLGRLYPSKIDRAA